MIEYNSNCIYRVRVLTEHVQSDFFKNIRAWFFENTGNEGIEWQCGYLGHGVYEFRFSNAEHATLFALTWL